MKWKFLIIAVLSAYSSISQVNYPKEEIEKGVADSTDLLKKSCAIAFSKYQIGDRFYFPIITEKGKKRIRGYKYISKDKKPAPDVYYHQIAGKTFTIEEIQDNTSNDKDVKYKDSPYYLLKSQDNIELIYPYYVEDLRTKKDNEIKVSLILPEAIYLDETDKFKQQYLNKELFANFPLKQKKYRKITVTNVTPGTKDKPIRVFYSYNYQKKDTIDGKEVTENKVGKDSIDVCDCGTNVQRALIKNCKFSNFLLIEDPQKNVKDSELFWDAIMDGRIVIGMKEKHVTTALGKPLKIETDSKKADPVVGKPEKPKTSKNEKASEQKVDNAQEITIKTMTYKNYIVVLENETVKSAKKIE